jgi:alpha-galactosidase
MRFAAPSASRLRVLLLLPTISVPHLTLQAQNPAPKPPMGWSEWDAYGLTVTEAGFRANAQVLATLKQYGWQYAMLDAGWYEADPTAPRPARNYQLDPSGRLIPAPNRFPSAANAHGFKPLADWLHARGLKLGIHVMLGIPRQAVDQNTLLANSSFHAAEAADTTQTCPWDPEFYAVKDTPAGQVWYDSILQQYAAWGVDLIKIGCINTHFRPTEIRQISQAIQTTHRPIVLSLSPGPPPQPYAAFAAQYAQLLRISPEHWDVWTTPENKNHFPVGLRDDFDLLAQWAPAVKPGTWIDPDDLPNGYLGPTPPVGQPRTSQLTHDEQRSEFTLWAFARAPLIEGANLTRLDPFTRSLITDRLLLDIDQNATETHPLTDLPPGWTSVRIWEATTLRAGHAQHHYALFNLGDTQLELHPQWTELGLPKGPHTALNQATHQQKPPSGHLDISLPAHGSAVYTVH